MDHNIRHVCKHDDIAHENVAGFFFIAKKTTTYFLLCSKWHHVVHSVLELTVQTHFAVDWCLYIYFDWQVTLYLLYFALSVQIFCNLIGLVFDLTKFPVQEYAKGQYTGLKFHVMQCHRSKQFDFQSVRMSLVPLAM